MSRKFVIAAALAAAGASFPAQAASAAPANALAAVNASLTTASRRWTTRQTSRSTSCSASTISVLSPGISAHGSPAATHPNKGYRLAPYSGETFVNENYAGSQQTQVTAINDWGNTWVFTHTSGANYGFLTRTA